MRIELVNTGSELLCGSVLNSHAVFFGQTLLNLGCRIARQTAINDDGTSIKDAIVEALNRGTDLIFTTGGLGPTADDITKQVVSEVCGISTFDFDEDAARNIRERFGRRGHVPPEKAFCQAKIPRGATVLYNQQGTAPGLIMPCFKGRSPTWIIMLPGPPRELIPMVEDQVIPWMKKNCPLEKACCQIFRTTGIGESLVEDKVGSKLEAIAGLEIGYCAHPGAVDIRLIVKAGDDAVAESLMRQGSTIIEKELGEFLYGYGNQKLEEVVVALLTKSKSTVSTAESCTGGHISNRLTNVSGSSRVFMGGIISYSNSSKAHSLDVEESVIEQHGAVSEPVVRRMAEGSRLRFGTTFALAVTGIAGPEGGTAEKPVGTTFLALATPSQTTVRKELFKTDRETFKLQTSQVALDMLRKEILNTRLLA